MRSERLDITHKDILYDRLRRITIPISEYSYSNLYLFRNTHEYEVIFDKEIFIRGRTYDKHRYIMPTQELSALDPDYIKAVLKEADFIFPVAEEWLSPFPGNAFDLTYRHDDTDYIYTIDKMSTYPGSKLHKKKNLLNQFLAAYKHQAKPLTKANMDDAFKVLDIWQKKTGLAKEQTDYRPCKEALSLYDELILCGGIYYVQDQPAGFIVGEELNEQVFALHFAKADTGFKGIYQYMYNNFANILPDKYKYLNFEQDLGKPALRLAKASYVPDIMLKKYRVSIKR